MFNINENAKELAENLRAELTEKIECGEILVMDYHLGKLGVYLSDNELSIDRTVGNVDASDQIDRQNGMLFYVITESHRIFNEGLQLDIVEFKKWSAHHDLEVPSALLEKAACDNESEEALEVLERWLLERDGAEIFRKETITLAREQDLDNLVIDIENAQARRKEKI